jgi:hypothetical protein
VNAARRALVAGLSGVFIVDTLPPKRGGAAQDPARRFIVAFELSGEKGFEFTWPHASLPRFPERQVLMVVQSMPRARQERGQGALELPASRYLRINGALRRPLHGTAARGEGEEFLVPLPEGRLHLSLTLPEATSIDPSRRKAVIRLYGVKDAEGESQ